MDKTSYERKRIMNVGGIKRLVEDIYDRLGSLLDFGSSGFKTDTIAESTSAAGVTIDGVLIKDSVVTASSGFVGALNGNVTATTVAASSVSGALNGSLSTGNTGSITVSAAALAAGGTAIGNAAAVTTIFTAVTGADNSKAVVLPSATAGRFICIRNTSVDKTLPVFPAVNDTINGGTANSSESMPANSAWFLVAENAVAWWSIPKTPS
jgi:hypothetical protein